jgi:diaminohydroxyphosphoribosylaminopyrimidine deaminase/5-amino-6-(5-phosphoribosylamino)uracil reductase
MVGAVISRDGQVVAVGHHARFGGPHAEREALAIAGPAARGATLHVTLEPCCHWGKTPPCTEAIIAAGITRVVAAIGDPNTVVSGGGFQALRAAGIEVEVGIEADAARRLLGPYLKAIERRRPFVTAKWAMTLDGKIATESGNSRWITNERSRARVHELRGRVDGIVVGLGTVLADDPELTARPPGPRIATRVVLDSACRTPLESKLAKSARETPLLIASTTGAPRDRVDQLREIGCEVGFFGDSGRVSIDALLIELGLRGWTNLLVEGGGHVLGSFWDAREVDSVEVFVAPRIEGGDHPMTSVRGAGLRTMSESMLLESVVWDSRDGDAWFRGLVRQPAPDDSKRRDTRELT